MLSAAAFDAHSEPIAGRLTRDRIDSMLTIAPPPLALRIGANAGTSAGDRNNWCAISRRASSRSGAESRPFFWLMPALFDEQRDIAALARRRGNLCVVGNVEPHRLDPARIGP